MTPPRIASHFILLVLLAVSGTLAADQGHHDDNPPPPPPSSNTIVKLKWNLSPTAGIKAYKVYRRANLTIAPALLGAVPGDNDTNFRYRDWCLAWAENLLFCQCSGQQYTTQGKPAIE